MTCTQHHTGGHGASCCCGGGHHSRRFLSKEEKIHQLEHYLEELKKEAAEAEKRIKVLKESDDKDHMCCCS